MSNQMGLRERKKLRTRETIVEVAIRRFAERGYDETTVAQIAEDADVSPSTFFTYFRAKEDVVFEHYEAALLDVAEQIELRPASQTTVEAFDSSIRPRIVAFRQLSELGILRARAIHAHDDLRKALRHRFSDHLEAPLRAGYARDLDDAPDGVRPMLLAGATLGALNRFEAMKMAGIETGTASSDELLEMFDALISLLGAALEAFQTS